MNYFGALRTPLIAGRDFSEADTSTNQQAAIVSDSMAKKFWPEGNAVGQRIKFGANNSTAAWMTIVGVVGNVRINWWDPPTASVIYRPCEQAPQRSMFLMLRTTGNPTSYVKLLCRQGRLRTISTAHKKMFVERTQKGLPCRKTLLCFANQFTVPGSSLLVLA